MVKITHWLPDTHVTQIRVGGKYKNDEATSEPIPEPGSSRYYMTCMVVASTPISAISALGIAFCTGHA